MHRFSILTEPLGSRRARIISRDATHIFSSFLISPGINIEECYVCEIIFISSGFRLMHDFNWSNQCCSVHVSLSFVVELISRDIDIIKKIVTYSVTIYDTCLIKFLQGHSIVTVANATTLLAQDLQQFRL